MKTPEQEVAELDAAVEEMQASITQEQRSASKRKYYAISYSLSNEAYRLLQIRALGDIKMEVIR